MKSFYILLFSIAILSCQKEKTSLPIEENSIAISSQLKTNKLQTIEFILKNDTLISGKEGTKIWITKDLFENYTNGKITFELKEFYTKEDMILNGLSTITDKDELLESSGMFYINFKEGNKQLKIKNGKSYKVEIPNKPLAESNIYYNDNDSIFRWELGNKNLYVSMIDYFKNGQYGIKVGTEGIGGFFKDVRIDSLEIVKKRDSIALLKLLEKQKKDSEIFIFNEEFGDGLDSTSEVPKLTKEEIIERKSFFENQRQIYSFTSDKLGWINIDKVLTYDVMKEILFKNDNQSLKYFSINIIYPNNRSVLNYNLSQFSKYLLNVKIVGKIKIVIYANSGNKIMFDSIYIDKNSMDEFDINFKETTLDKLKQELISN